MRGTSLFARAAAVLGAVLVSAGVMAAPAQAAAPAFKAPFPCGQRWTYSHHGGEVRLALDFIRSDGGTTAGTPVLASAAGTAARRFEAQGAGNYIDINHGGGWHTYYFHLRAFSVADGAHVEQGQRIGITGTTGNSSGEHIHYEQLLNGVGQNIVIEGKSLAPYPASYGVKSLTSTNCGGDDSEPSRYFSPDVTGDGFADLVATKPDGTMWLYSNSFVRDDGVPYSAVRQIGSGWGGFDKILGADVTGDGFADLVATKPDGTMWLYSNSFVRDDGVPYSAVRQIGSGWGGFDKILGADVTGDGFADLVATKPDGTMWLYSNSFVRDDGVPYSAVRQIGSGWGGFDKILGADVTGDGFADLVATKPDGTMWLYSNSFVRDDGVPYSAVRQIGSGWGGFDKILGADVTGDGFADLVATKPDGTMWLYSNSFVRDDGVPYSAVRQIGSGWGGYNRITA
jgi:hypothetical protein